MMTKKFSLFGALLATALISPRLYAQSCPWASNGYGSLGYSNYNITMANQSGQSPPPVLTNPHVHLRFWGSYWINQCPPFPLHCPPPQFTEIGALENANRAMFANSSFWSRYSQYNVPSGSEYNTTLNETDLVGTAGAPTTLTDAQIGLRLAAENNLNLVGNDIFVVFLPPYVHSGTGNAGSAYHSLITTSTGTTLVYGVIEYTRSCGAQCTSGDPAVNISDSEVETGLVAHEVMEAATDPYGVRAGGPTGYAAYPLFPNTNPGLEIGDACNGRERMVSGVRWQQVWLQNQCRCDGSGLTFNNQALHITNPSTNTTKCLDLPGSNTTNGTPLHIWDCNGGSNQQWSAMADGTIRSGVDSNKCIDLAGWENFDHGVIQIWDCNGGTNQVWSVESSSAYNWNGNIFGYGGLCIDLDNGDISTGTGVQYYQCHNQQWNQQWTPSSPP